MNDLEAKEVYESEYSEEEIETMKNPLRDKYYSNYNEMFNEKVNLKCTSLLENEKYYGVIKNVFYDEGTYDVISIKMELDVDKKKEVFVKDFSFGGDYNEYTMENLITFLSTAENAKEMLKTFKAATIKQIAKSMKIIEGAPVSVISKTSQKSGKNYLVLSLLGKYNKDNNCIEG